MDTKIQDVKKEKGIGVKRVLLQAGTALVWALLGALLGRAELPFGALPLGVGLLCASSTYSLAVLGGNILSVIGRADAIPVACTYVIAVLLRLIFCLATRYDDVKRTGVKKRGFFEWAFEEPVYLRAVSAAVSSFALGAYRLGIGGFLYYDLFGMLVSIGVASVLTVVLYPLFSNKRIKSARAEHVWKDLGYTAVCACAVFSLRGLAPYGISLSVLLCMLITFYTTKRRGLKFGAFVAIAAGLCVSVEYAPLFVFAAVCYCLLSTVSTTLGCFSAFFVGIAWGIYINGVSAFLSLFSALMTATVVFLVTERLFLSNKEATPEKENSEEQSFAEGAVLDSSDIAVARLDDTSRRIKELCASLASLSNSLTDDVNECSGFEKTQKHGTSTISAEIGDERVLVKKSGVKTNGKVRTPKEKQYAIDELSDGASFHDAESGESFAHDISAISDYIADIMADNETDYRVDEDLACRISKCLTRKFPSLSLKVGVFGKGPQKILVCCNDISRLRSAAAKIEREINKELDALFDIREPFEVGDVAYAMLERRPMLVISFAERRRNAAGQTVCGDSVGTIKDSDGGKAYAFISDGMGSGKRAAVTAELCAAFLDKLLPINGGSYESIKSTLGVINSFIRRRNGSSTTECCATVDLGVFDLVEGKVSFYKSGAAPTFVFRDGALFKLRTRTVPIGIIKEPDFGRVNMEILPGDVLVMVSDGATDGKEECPELFELLRSRLMTHNADQLADAVIAYAESMGCSDDVSVIVAKIDDRVFEKERTNIA
jgi:serine phosphatase RsbU (regulator of sigma subunit)